MTFHSNIRQAFATLSATKWRSLLTMLGVIISVLSVVTIVGLGEGVKRQLVGQIESSGSDLITIRGGDVLGERGELSATDLANVFSRTSLSGTDLETIQKTDGVEYAAPFASISGDVTPTGSTEARNVTVVATNEHAAQVLGQPMASGNFFGPNDTNASTAIVGKSVAEQLFKQNVPIGQSFELKGRKITVGGVFTQFDFSPLTPGLDYNNVIFIPYGTASELAGSSLLPYQVLVRPVDPSAVDSTAAALQSRLSEAHNGQRDFTVLKASDAVRLADGMVVLITKLVGAIAIVALIVGGVGIMNVTLVSVSERTQEIGVRKSVGATNGQILSQFLAEAVVLSVVGSLIGIVLALLANYFIRISTSFEPSLDVRVMAGTVIVAVIVGSFFGVVPAVKASRKDPIQALRRF